MGAYNGNPRNEFPFDRELRSQRNNPPKDGRISNLVDQFSELGVSNDTSRHGLVQVMDSVQAAENIIVKQLEENGHLRAELQRKTQELEKYKVDVLKAQTMPTDVSLNEHIQTSMENRHYSDSSKANGTLKVSPGGLAGVDITGLSHLLSPSSTSFCSSRYQNGREFDSSLNFSGDGLMQMSTINSPSNLWKQDLSLKVREHEEEIVQLRRCLTDYSMRESQLRNEKHVLEKHIAYIRMAFDQQQQDVVELISKAISYRQDTIEENIRLTYALQAAQQERSTFISSLIPILQEYNLHPLVLDAQSIVGNLKLLFKSLNENLTVIEDKLESSQYQLAPWRSDALNVSASSPQSPSHSVGAALTTSNKSGLEIMPQSTYSHVRTPISSPPNIQTTRADWEALAHYSNNNISSSVITENFDHDNLGKSSSPADRNSSMQETAVKPTVRNSHVHFGEENFNNNPAFGDLVSGNEMDDPEAVGYQNVREPSVHWGPYLTPVHNDPNSSLSPYLPPVPEEPGSFSEEDDPLPGIEALQITGEAFPGREIQACGYSINGTTSCNFEWVRYLEDGSVSFIAGAKQPIHLVTADDVDSYLAIEVQPLDDRKRKGELVKVFANEQRKITCDPKMQEQIEKTLLIGHTSYEVSLSAGYLDIWEPAILAIKREGFSIKCNGPRGVVVTEKFSRSIIVEIRYGHPTEFSIHSSTGNEHLLRAAANNVLRDTIVLTMKLFIMRAVEKRKGKKKGLFFK